MQLEILKNISIYFYSGSGKKCSWGGGAILNSKYNPDIHFKSGFRKTSQVGGGGGCNVKS